MKNSLLLDQLEWTNFYKLLPLKRKRFMERFEQVQILIQLSFHYFASSHRKKEGITSENSNFPHRYQYRRIFLRFEEETKNNYNK